MKKILKVDNPNDYARFVDAPVLHMHALLMLPCCIRC